MFLPRRRYSRGRLARKRVRHFLLRVIGVLLAIAAVLSVASFLFSREPVRIRAIAVTGNSILSADALRALISTHLEGSYFFLFPRESIFLYPKRQIEASVLSAFPRAKRADVRFEDFHTISLTVAEREPHALWCPPPAPPSSGAGGGEADAVSAPCFFLDDSGFIYTEAPDFSGDAYLYYYGALEKATEEDSPLGTRVLPENEFRTLTLFLDALSDLDLSVVSLATLDEYDFEIMLEGGARLLVRRDDDLSSVLSSIEAAFRSDPLAGSLERLDYVDFRFGNKVYYAWR